MKTASLRQLRNYSAVMKWIEAGEEVKLSDRGKVVARLVPENARLKAASAAKKKIKLRLLTVEQKAALFDE